MFLRKVLQVDTHSKKGDPTEPRIMVSEYYNEFYSMKFHHQFCRTYYSLWNLYSIHDFMHEFRSDLI